ncbi:CHRD domain-containing protein [Christiangramia sabulilitoris]|uniref:Superoxide dismutase family protein n=1 Tax=Christiangramia sabulilitoris TaxID=2583991 RepID=A0A550I6P2_9FLAO|nr:CHRD domain-containing protein [Christiangramia sabulilitoris]TRO66645.1 superoxide dismutase family protein [Christiangramia sabulilitoris]
MKNLLRAIFLALPFILLSCSSDDDAMQPVGQQFMGDTQSFDLSAVSDPSISGTATFIENEDNSTTVEIELTGTSSGMHPAHIHFNTAAEGGDIALTFEPVDGSTGTSTTTFSALNDGTPVTYDEIVNFDGYINVHLSSDDLATLVAQGDIGENDLTGESKSYELGERDIDGIMGTAIFEERVNGEALATIMLQNTPDGGMHPAHIHLNTAVEGGDIDFTFNAVNGTTGMSKTNVSALNGGEALGYADILDYDGYINVHLSADELGVIVAQGDIGQNELTGESKSYELGEKDVEGIMGTALFEERVNGEALATLMLENTPDGGMHPAHIHMNTAAEGGDIAFTFNMVDGTTGMSETNVSALDGGEEFGYADVLEYDGYINVHLSAEELGVIVAQGDIGQNELTGESMTYQLSPVAVASISGTAIFQERVNGETLVILSLVNTIDGEMHPAHIHMGSVADAPGDIAITLNSVNGTTGISRTNVSSFNGDEEVTYETLIQYDGYINVHLSPEDLATLVAQGNVGANAS